MGRNLDEKLLSIEQTFDGKLLHMERWIVELPNGKLTTREIIRHVGASAVVAVNDRDEICMVRQYRAALGRVTLEVPAGKLDHKGADPLECARRELSEETGLTAQHWQHLGPIYTTVGFCDERIDLYLAQGLSEGEPHCDEDEFVETEYIPYGTLLGMIQEGKLSDAKSVCALLLAQPFLKKSTN